MIATPHCSCHLPTTQSGAYPCEIHGTPETKRRIEDLERQLETCRRDGHGHDHAGRG